MGYLGNYWKKYWKGFAVAVIFLSVEAMADLLEPTIMSKIIDKAVAHSNIPLIEKYGALMLLVTFIGAGGACVRNVMSVSVSQNFAMDLRLDLYKKIQSFSFDNIDRFGNASLVTRLTNDVTRLQTFANGIMRMMLKAPLIGIGSIIVAIHLNPRLSIILVAIIPFIALIIFMNMRISYPYFRKVQMALDRVNMSMQEYLSGIRVVKVFNRFAFEQERFHKSNENLSGLSTSAAKVASFFGPMTNLTLNAGIIAVLWFGGIGVSRGNMQVGSIIAFTNYMMQILFALMIVNNAFNMLVRAKASAERIGDVMKEKSRMFFPEKTVPENTGGLKGHVTFKDVSFAYHKNGEEAVPALKSVNLDIRPGETVGIIGPIGSGKTTLINLIPRFYDPDEGEVLIDGRSVKNYREDDLRKRIAIVPQKTLLFSGTIKENILWGNKNAGGKEMEEAAKVAQADDFIRKTPGGYDAIIGQGGVNFSGGQKQRIAIARALIRKPEILILDDATSAVDGKTDRKIKEGLRIFSSRMTCLIIAHSISAVMDADKIVVMADGKITDVGTHGDLLNRSAVYRDIYESQIGKEAGPNA